MTAKATAARLNTLLSGGTVLRTEIIIHHVEKDKIIAGNIQNDLSETDWLFRGRGIQNNHFYKKDPIMGECGFRCQMLLL